MVRRTSRKITYLLAADNSHHGHTLGVNALAVDPTARSFNDTGMRASEVRDSATSEDGDVSGILYSAGRDGLINAWNLHDMNINRHSIDPFDTLDESGDLSEIDELDETNGHNESSQVPQPQQQPETENSRPPQAGTDKTPKQASGKSTFRTQVQMHTHWVNDIILTDNYRAVVSCSSDLTVKLWRPDDGLQATIGHHHDFIKCLAAPGTPADSPEWIASGGLDRKVILWDLNSSSEKLTIDVGAKGENQKGSVYALAVGGDHSSAGANSSLIGTGGPDSIVRLWDPRTSGQSVINFVGHTDNIRSILINPSGTLVLTGSSDSTVKLWSVTAGRLIYTLTMHENSVWSLHSEHPDFKLFHSSDRVGLVAKTDLRGVSDADDALSVLVCNEHQGVSKLEVAGDCLWTATANSRIHRWKDVDTTPVTIEAFNRRRRSMSTSSVRPRRRSSSASSISQPAAASLRVPASVIQTPSRTSPSTTAKSDLNGIPLSAILSSGGPSSTAGSAATTVAGGTVGPADDIANTNADPVRHNPEETIEGQTGLINHVLLNDRRRVLTVDTAGEVMLWDLVKGTMIRSFGGRDINDVADEINTFEAMANWCHVNTRMGQLAVVLDEYTCFDAEIYADEISRDLPVQPAPVEFREDQRINLGKLILRNLFSNLINTLVLRDDALRKAKRDMQSTLSMSVAATPPPPPLRLPPGTLSFSPSMYSMSTNGASVTPIQTPGLAIGLATPAPTYNPAVAHVATSSGAEGFVSSDSAPVITDYFSSALALNGSSNVTDGQSVSDIPQTPVMNSPLPVGVSGDMSSVSTPSFMGRLRSFGKGRLAKATPTEQISSPGGNLNKLDGSASNSSGAVATTTSSSSVSSADGLATVEEGELQYDDNLYGVSQRLLREYEVSGSYNNSLLTLAPPNEVPVIPMPAATTIIVSEQRADAGGLVDVYKGTVGSCGDAADIIKLEQELPTWVSEFLLLNKIPTKDLVKVSFVLQPYDDSLPALPNGNARLNAYRMLRARKILSHVDERLADASPSPLPHVSTRGDANGNSRPNPEEWLELLCQGQVLDNSFTLATIRARIWRSGGDVVLMYRRKSK
ncbi:hypothetical protein V1511DRAFT_357712 [Dipodascopsis uninucleata]